MKSLKKIRMARGLTQKKLAEKSCVPRICISRYETSKSNPNMKNAFKLANSLGVTVEELLENKEGG